MLSGISIRALEHVLYRLCVETKINASQRRACPNIHSWKMCATSQDKQASGQASSLPESNVFFQTSKTVVDLWYQPCLDSPQQVVDTNVLQILHA